MVLRGANKLPWPRGFQIGVTFTYIFFQNNNEKCDFKSLHQKLCNSQMFFCLFVFVVKFVFFTFEKKGVLSFFLSEQRKLATKKLKSPSESLDNFASCHAAVFK